MTYRELVRRLNAAKRMLDTAAKVHDAVVVLNQNGFISDAQSETIELGADVMCVHAQESIIKLVIELENEKN